MMANQPTPFLRHPPREIAGLMIMANKGLSAIGIPKARYKKPLTPRKTNMTMENNLFL